MEQRTVKGFQRNDQERTKLGNGVQVFTPTGYKPSQLQCQELEEICSRLEVCVAPVRLIHLNPDKEKGERAHNISFTFNWENKALER